MQLNCLRRPTSFVTRSDIIYWFWSKWNLYGAQRTIAIGLFLASFFLVRLSDTKKQFACTANNTMQGISFDKNKCKKNIEQMMWNFHKTCFTRYSHFLNWTYALFSFISSLTQTQEPIAFILSFLISEWDEKKDLLFFIRIYFGRKYTTCL